MKISLLYFLLIISSLEKSILATDEPRVYQMSKQTQQNKSEVKMKAVLMQCPSESPNCQQNVTIKIWMNLPVSRVEKFLIFALKQQRNWEGKLFQCLQSLRGNLTESFLFYFIFKRVLKLLFEFIIVKRIFEWFWQLFHGKVLQLKLWVWQIFNERKSFLLFFWW